MTTTPGSQAQAIRAALDRLAELQQGEWEGEARDARRKAFWDVLSEETNYAQEAGNTEEQALAAAFADVTDISARLDAIGRYYGTREGAGASDHTVEKKPGILKKVVDAVLPSRDQTHDEPRRTIGERMSSSLPETVSALRA